MQGKLIDSRHVSHIDQQRFHTVKQAAELLDCSVELIYKLISKNTSRQHADDRHTALFTKRSYNTKELAELLNVHRDAIYKLRMYGHLEQSPLHKAVRIPSWSVCDLLDECSYQNTISGIHFISIPTNTIRIQGWSLASYIAANCSEI